MYPVILLLRDIVTFYVTVEQDSRGLREKLHHRACRTRLAFICEGQPLRQPWQAARSSFRRTIREE